MRIYTTAMEAVREVERDLWEMGIEVHPQTMQNKEVGGLAEFKTKELQSYAFQLTGVVADFHRELEIVKYLTTPDQFEPVVKYIDAEWRDRLAQPGVNPGESYKERPDVWNEFVFTTADGPKMHYTYSERLAPQLVSVLCELIARPDTRQAILTIHSNISTGSHGVWQGIDLQRIGGAGRVPCSLYYQFLRRNGKVDMIYAMRSCDFLTHFPVDLCLALRMHKFVCDQLGGLNVGTFTYLTGSLHAYHKDMAQRGIF